MTSQTANYETDAVDAALAEYMRRTDAGQQIDRDSYVAEYPQFAEELGEFFDAAEIVERMAGPTLASTAGGGELTKTVDTHVGSLSTDSAAEKSAAAAPQAEEIALPETFGRYRIEKQLGTGAMGIVYLARDTQLNRQVALKTPTFDTGRDPDLIERFYREAQSAATLRHANICPVHDVGEIDGVHYISMAYIDGKPLSDFVAADKTLPVRTVVSLVRKLALALDHAHRQGVIHRDLKPANIMIDRQKEPLIMDFGLARRLDTDDESRITQEGMILGTPAYMSAEQIQGDRTAGASCDIHALGVILFELITGDLPFRGTIAAVIGQIMTKDAPPPPSEFRQGVAPEIDAVCRKMMARKGEDRYASMKEVAADLTAYLRTSNTDKSSRPTAAPQQTVTTDEGLAAFLAMSPEDEFPSLPPRPQRRPRRQRRRQRMLTQLVSPWKNLPQRTKTIATTVAASLLLLMAVVFMLRTPDGMLRVEVTGKNVQVLVDGTAIKLTDGEWSGKKKAREHRLALKIGGQLLSFDAKTKQFTFADGTVSVKIAGVEINSKQQFEVVRDQKTVMTIELIRVEHPGPDDPSDPVLPVWPAFDGVSLELVQTFDDVTLQSQSTYANFALAFWPNDEGKLRILHSMTPDGRLELRDVATGQKMPLPFPLPDGVISVAFSDDGTRLLVGTGATSQVSLWDLTSNKHEPLFQSDAGGRVLKVQFDSFGHLVAVASGGKLEVTKWDASDGKQLVRFEHNSKLKHGPGTADVSPDGSTVLHRNSTKESRAVRHDLNSGRPLDGELPEHSAMWMAYSPAGKYLATWGYDKLAIVSDAKTGKEIWRFAHPLRLPAAAFSPDDRYLVTAPWAGSGGEVHVWDLQSGEMVAKTTIPVLKDVGLDAIPSSVIRPGGLFAREIAFAPDGRHFALACNGSPLTVWKIKEIEPAVPVAGAGNGTTVPVSPAAPIKENPAQRAAAALTAAQILEGHTNRVVRVLFTPDGERVVSASNGDHHTTKGRARYHVRGSDNSVRVWSVESAKQIRKFDPRGGKRYGPQGIAVSADGCLLALGAGWFTANGPSDPHVYVWDLSSGELRFDVAGPGNGTMRSVAFTPDGSQVFVSRTGTVQIRSLPDGEMVSKNRLFGRKAEFGRTTWSPDLAHVLGAVGFGHNEAVAWDRKTGEIVKTFEGHSKRPTHVVISPDGTRVLSCAPDFSVRLWDWESAREIRRVDNLDSNVVCIAFSPDGRQFLTGSDDGFVALYETATGAKLARIEGHVGTVHDVAFSPSGLRAASAGEDKTVRLWTIKPPTEGADQTAEGRTERAVNAAASEDDLEENADD